MTASVPVIGLAGALGAGKTTVLNHVLRPPGARIGVIVNDFGAINVDAGLISGHIDEVAAITGGCICCLPDTAGLDEALVTLSRPELNLDVIIVEASGVADPLSLAHLLRFSGAEHVRYGGIVEVIDTAELDVDTDGWKHRLRAASLVVVNKLDTHTVRRRRTLMETVRHAAQASPTRPVVVGARHGSIDPTLLFDMAKDRPDPDTLDFSSLYVDEHRDHVRAASVWVDAPHPVDADNLLNLLESPPPHAYRMKGRLAIRTPRGARPYIVNTVGGSIHVAPDTLPSTASPGLVCIGPDLNVERARNRLEATLGSRADTATPEGMRRLRRHLRLSR